MIDETTALSIAAPDRAMARLAFLAGGASIFVVWNITTVLGALGAGALGGPAQAALDAVVPAASSPCCGRGCRRPSRRRPSSGGSPSAVRSWRWR